MKPIAVVKLFSLSLLIFTSVTLSAQATTVKGYIDGVSGNIDNFYVAGWACQTGYEQSINVHTYTGGPAGRGSYVGSTKASNNSGDGISSACGTTLRKHAFKHTFSPKQVYKNRGKPIYIHGISIAGTGHKQISRSGIYSFPDFPTSRVRGHIDDIYKSGSSWKARGWACQTNYAKSISVKLYVNGPAGSGTFIASGTANRTLNSAVSNSCGTNGVKHTFHINIPESVLNAHAGKAVYAEGISLLDTGNFTLYESGDHNLPNANQAPSVTATSPNNNQQFTHNSRIVATADASDRDGTISKVEFRLSNGSWKSDSSSPYRYDFGTLTSGSHTIYYRARDNDGDYSPTKRINFAINPSVVKGNIESVGDNIDDFFVSGWACQTGYEQSINIQTYTDGPESSGTYVGAITANDNSSVAVAGACGTNLRKHAFLQTFSPQVVYKNRGKSIFIHGLSIAGTGNELINNSNRHSFPDFPNSRVTGHIDDIYKNGDDWIARGWACQTHYGKSIEVKLYVNGPADSGTFVASGVANKTLNTPVSDSCGTNGIKHTFHIQLPNSVIATHAGQPIYAEGMSVLGTGDVMLYQSGDHVIPSNNVQPEITLASPQDNQKLSLHTNIIAIANAADVDGSIVQTEFKLEGEDGSWKIVSNPPYQFDFGLLPIGESVIMARALDDSGDYSETVSVSVYVEGRSRKVIFIHTDLLGSPVAETNEDGN